MNRTSAAAALLICSSMLLAQDRPQTSTSVLVLPFNSTFGVCPIGMHARQGEWDHTITVRRGEQQKSNTPFGQRIVLALVDAHLAPIVAATLVVRGFDGKNHMVQTVGGDGGNVTRNLRAVFAKQADGSVSADIYVPGFTSVTSLQLQSVSYADGSVWRVTASNACRVVPDPLMLVAAH